MALHPDLLGLTLDPKLTYNAHIQSIATHAQKPLQVIKALTGTTWGKIPRDAGVRVASLPQLRQVVRGD